MKKEYRAFLCAAVLLLTGCAQTPEADIVTRKNTEALADGAVRAAGVDAEIAQAELMEGEIVREAGSISAGAYTAFRFLYARNVEGVPVAVTSSNYISEDETAKHWPYEKIIITVSEVGIQDSRWEARSEGTEDDCAMEIHVDKICLSLMRVRNDGDKRQGLHVPTWVFYGTETENMNLKRESCMPF